MIRQLTRGATRSLTRGRSKTRRNKSGGTLLFSPDTKDGKDEDAAVLVAKMTRSQIDHLLLKKLKDGKKLKLDEIKEILAEAERKSEAKPSKQSEMLLANQLSPASHAALVDDFANFDVNGDGTITLDEFIKIMHRGLQPGEEPYEDGELVALFQAMDTDGNGAVDYAEFAEQWAADHLDQLEAEKEDDEMAA